LKKPILIALLGASCVLALGETPTNLFLDALTQGHSSALLPKSQINDKVIEMLRDRSQSSGPIFQEAFLMYRFKEQPHCGRLEFFITQPSSQSVWREMGGQLNLCENGEAPMQLCTKGMLIPNGLTCPDKTKPVDTDEIKESIKRAVAQGSLTPALLHQKLKPKVAP
jgi:hypothetical protein